MDKELIKKIKSGELKINWLGEGISEGNPFGSYKLSETKCPVCNEVISEIWRSPSIVGDSVFGSPCYCSRRHYATEKFRRLAELVRELKVPNGSYSLSEYGAFEVEDGRLKTVNGFSMDVDALRPSKEAVDLVRKSYERVLGNYLMMKTRNND